MDKVTCQHCESVYELTQHKLMMRDKDSISCTVCGNELHSWNSSHSFTVKLISRGEWPKPTAPQL